MSCAIIYDDKNVKLFEKLNIIFLKKFYLKQIQLYIIEIKSFFNYSIYQTFFYFPAFNKIQKIFLFVKILSIKEIDNYCYYPPPPGGNKETLSPSTISVFKPFK